jgi:HD superfamily phosphohydrolase
VVAVKVFRDPIHDYISFAELEETELLPIIDTFAFQRLRRIHQNGAAFLAYHGLERSRFSHALGTYQCAKLLIARLREVTSARGEDLEPFTLSRQAEMGFKAACLLHDIGHPSFSHAGERFFQAQRPDLSGELRHESWTTRIIDEDPALKACTDDRDWAADMKEFLSVGGRHPLGYLQKFYSGNADVDRFDYLARDSHSCGAGYGDADFRWLLQSLDIALLDLGWGTPRWEVVFDEARAAFAIEQMLLARRSMYAQVYFHKTVRASEALLLAILQRALFLGCYQGAASSEETVLPGAFGSLSLGDQTSVEDYLHMDDTHVLRAIVDWSSLANDAILRDLSRRFVNRETFKSVPVEGNALQALQDMREEKVGRLQELVDQCGIPTGSLGDGERLSDYYLTIDEPQTDVYKAGEDSLYLRARASTGDRFYPFEAHNRMGPRFSGTGTERNYSRTFIVVPHEAHDQAREEVASWL